MWENDFTGRLRPLVRMSTKPAIGLSYIVAHPEIFDVSQFYIPNGFQSFMATHPRYYLKKLELWNPERFAELKEKRSDAGKIAFDNMQLDGRPYLEILRSKELDMQASCAKMRRKVD